MAVFAGQVVVAVRAPCGLEIDAANAEKTFTQFWLNSVETRLIRKAILPEDRIEVRYQEKTELMEWRVVRALVPVESIEVEESFRVFVDPRDEVGQESGSYTDMGDLPYQSWLEDVYRNGKKESGTGSILVEGDETQAEHELAKITIRQELNQIEEQEEIRLKADRSQATGSNDVIRIKGDSSPSLGQEKTLVSGGNQPNDETVLQVVPGQGEVDQDPVFEGTLDEVMKRLKKSENQEVALIQKLEMLKHEERKKTAELKEFKKKMQHTFSLLEKKEISLYKKENEVKNLKKDLEAGKRSKAEQDGPNPFREKALQMFEKLKEVREANAALEKTIFQLRNRSPEAAAEPEAMINEAFTSGRASEDGDKKFERVNKLYEAEKMKTKTLLDRALAAEKEAQSSTPLINDLEAKIEHTLKTAAQYKKEIDNVKLKLVQSDAEKNKIKNELLKAQAEIKTLMKRQAS
jgi:hypothetical protein